MSLDQIARQTGVDAACVNIIAEFEGCLKPIGGGMYAPYKCPANVGTIGYGTTVWEDGQPVRIGDAPINKTRCEELLAYEIGRRYAPAVDALKLPFKYENMRSACISLTLNIGSGGFKKSTLSHLIANKQYERAADEFLKWNKGGGRVLRGLTRRRIAERKLFLTSGGNSGVGSTKTFEPELISAQIAKSPGFASRFFGWIKRTF